MKNILGEARLVGGMVGGRHTVQAFLGDEHLFTVTADSDEEAVHEARRRLQGDAPAPASSVEIGMVSASGSTTSSRANLGYLPEVTDWREASARKLLDGFLVSEGHPNPSSTFQVKTHANEAGNEETFWTGAAGKEIGPRQRAYLAFYWLVSRNGALFYGRGIRLEAKMLWPDKGVMRDCLSSSVPLVAMAGGQFVLTPAGEAVVREVITSAHWPSLVFETPEAAPIASAVAAVVA